MFTCQTRSYKFGAVPQIGAGVAALASEADHEALPLIFSAAKVMFGHTEPAAGATGICSAMLR